MAKTANLLERYECGPFRFADDDYYDRHLVFDHVVPQEKANTRQRFEAMASAIRDLLTQRWLLTGQTHDRKNPKQVYYLSMEFLIGRTLANNITNLQVEEFVRNDFASDAGQDWQTLFEQEPDAGLGNGGLGRLAACFIDSLATLQIPAIGYGLRYEYGMFRQEIDDGRQVEHPDNWLIHPDPWEVVRPSQTVEVRLNCAFQMREGRLTVVPNVPTILRGIPYDRPVVGYGGRTINALRLWGAAAHDDFNFLEFSRGDFFDAVHEKVAAEVVTRVLYPDDSTPRGRNLRFVQEYFLVACSLADIVARFRRRGNDWKALPDKVAIQLNDTHPAMAVAELMRILLDDAKLGWDEAWDLTRRTLAYTNHTLMPEALETWPISLFEMMVPRLLEIIYEINRRFLDDVRARFPGRPWPSVARQPDRRRAGKAGSHGQPGDRRYPQHQRRRRDPFTTAADDRRVGLGRDLPGTVQQQDQRRDPAPLAASGKPRFIAPDLRARSATAGSAIYPSSRRLSLWPTMRRSATASARPSGRPRPALPTGSRRRPGWLSIPTPSSTAR